MQYCERDCEEDEFEGHFFFLSFLWRTTAVVAGNEGAVVFGEEEEDLG